ncbi:MAG: isocitrate lyase/phosphoenolpyruvate mutase family protein [Gemmatimonadaceae bacterium]|nr:isocitrate lyase/phosphoenolpyruvate mutase family protein [Gemmatimonadaceae bacterium]
MTPVLPSASAQLRALWARPGVVRAAGAHNAMGAQLAAQAGVDAIWSSGFEISTAHAVPDASILTMSEYLAAAQSIAQAVRPVPVIADCDTGYGNSSNVIRMVRLFEDAGVAAVCIEDKCFPKTNSFIAGKQELAPIAEFVGKILAAKNAQRSADFAVIARTEALIAGWGVDEALRRGEAYVRAGADALLVHDKSPTGAGVREFLARWTPSVPIVIVPTTYPTITLAECEALGVKTVIWANHGIRAAARAIGDLWQTVLRDGHTGAVESQIASMSTLFALQGMPAHTAAEREFDRAGGAPTRAIVLHAGAHDADPSLAPLTLDRPLSALDVNGTALLERQVRTLRQSGVGEIAVIAGHAAAATPATDARIAITERWREEGEVASLLAAPSLPDVPEARTLIAYGDVLVQPALLERLLATDEPAVIVVDRTPAPVEPVVRDRVRMPENVTGTLGRRFLAPDAPRPVAAIGAAVTPGDANGEFAGLLLVRSDVWPRFRAQAERCVAEDPRIALPDLLAAWCAGGEPLTALEITSGWLEIRRFEDYEAACRAVAR